MRLSTPVLRTALAAFAATAIVTTISACSSPAEPEETTETSTSETTETTAPEETTAEEETAAEGGLCTAEQFNSLTGAAAAGTEVTDAQLAAATATFEPAAVIAGLPVVCQVSMEFNGQSVAFAVLSGADATFTAVQGNVQTAGAEPTVAGGQMIATLGDQTVIAGPYSAISQVTDGFDTPEDLIVVMVTAGLM